jgi:trimethylamine:corrinoid methyltransferase-like protein
MNTLKYLRSQELWSATQGRKSIGTSRGYSGWLQGGSPSMADTARERVDKILKEHQVEPLDGYVERGLEDIIQAARKELISVQ